MLVPSIDIMGGQAVQLIGGKETAIEAGDPRPIAENFTLTGPIAVIDLDAAMGQGDNRELISELCLKYRCRVGGGIRSLEAAKYWLDSGAEQIILGTAARPQLLAQLPKERVLAALDAVHGEVVVEGWKTKTGRSIDDCLQELSDYVAGFLITFVEKEGRLGGTSLEEAQRLSTLAPDKTFTFAGGITNAEEIAQLDGLGADAQVGMALYSGKLSLAEAFIAPLRSPKDQLWPTVVVDEYDRALGFCYSNQVSLKTAIEEKRGIYWSRRRGLWRKGESSGATQQLLSVSLDCDRDCLRFKVRQAGPGFCHLESTSCWGPLGGLPKLSQTIQERLKTPVQGSYTQRLFNDPALLSAKLLEEAKELIDSDSAESANQEAADLIYFTLASLAKKGGSLAEVAHILDQRAQKVSRRPGNAKTSLEKANV